MTFSSIVWSSSKAESHMGCPGPAQLVHTWCGPRVGRDDRTSCNHGGTSWNQQGWWDMNNDTKPAVMAEP